MKSERIRRVKEVKEEMEKMEMQGIDDSLRQRRKKKEGKKHGTIGKELTRDRSLGGGIGGERVKVVR